MEDAGVYFDLFDARAVEFFEGRDDASLLAGAGGSVYEEVREVAALGLDEVVLVCVGAVDMEGPTRALRRSESSGW